MVRELFEPLARGALGGGLQLLAQQRAVLVGVGGDAVGDQEGAGVAADGKGGARRTGRKHAAIGWDVAEVIHWMRVEAKAQDAKMPTHDRTLLVHIGKWERGESVPQARYADVLTAVYGKTATELGLPDRSIPPIDSERWGRLYARYFDWTVKFL